MAAVQSGTPASSSSTASPFSSVPASPRNRHLTIPATEFKACILAVENDKFQRLILETCLTKHGFNLIFVDNGQEAIEALKGQKFAQASDAFLKPVTPQHLITDFEALNMRSASLPPSAVGKTPTVPQNTYSLKELGFEVAIVISDQNIPGMKGLETIKKIHDEIQKDLSCFLCTSEEGLDVQSYNLEKTHYIIKGPKALDPYVEEFKKIIEQKQAEIDQEAAIINYPEALEAKN